MTTTISSGELTVTVRGMKIRVVARRCHAPEQSAVFVDNDVACAADLVLAALTEKEADLGRLRYCRSVNEGGRHPEVDELYRCMNERLMTTHAAVATEAVRKLGKKITRQSTNDLFFSRHAGCNDCPCSPGVTVPGGIYLNGLKADILVSTV